MDLFQLAQHSTHNHVGHKLKRGEVFVSIRTLAERWGWSKSRTSRFIVCLTSGTPSGTLLELVSGTPGGSVYHIVDYDTWADTSRVERDTDSTGERDTERDVSGTRAGRERDKNNNEEGRMELFQGGEEGPSNNGKPKPKPKKKEVPLPDDWEPSESHLLKAKKVRVADLGLEVEKFKAHAEANDRRQKNWNGAFTQWILSDYCPKLPEDDTQRLTRETIW